MPEKSAKRESLAAIFQRLPNLGLIKPLRVRGRSGRRTLRNQVRQIFADGVVGDEEVKETVQVNWEPSRISGLR
jgi:hypothetical protein